MSDFTKIAIFGDIHEQVKFPYHQSTNRVFNWMLDNEAINNLDTLLISLGDIFDIEENSGEINHSVLNFYKKAKNRKKIINQGNHDQDKEKGSALDALKIIEGLEIIREPISMEIEGKNFLFIPHIYTNKDGVTMEERYSNLYKEDEFKDQEFDYCLFHVMDETRKFHKKSKVCDLSKLNIKKRIGGHDHTFNLDKGGNYLGSVQPNSSTEKDKTPKIYIIDLEKGEDYTIDVPLFINYYEVTYPNNLPKEIVDVEFPILNIHESLDRNESIDFYNKQAKELGIETLTINRVYRKRLMADKSEIETTDEDKKSIKTDIEYFDTFSREMNLSSGVDNIVRGVITNK